MKIYEAREQPETGRFIITPKIAAVWLAKYNRETNRPIRVGQVRLLKGVLERGEWKYNAESICFSRTRLINGQHRLIAVVETGIAIDTRVETGLPDEVYETYDQHTKRNAGDLLGSLGYKDALSVSGAAAWVWRYENDSIRSGGTPSPTQARLLLERLPDIVKSTEACRIVHKSRHTMTSTAIAIHFLAGLVNPDRRDLFFQGLASGENLSNGDPAFMLRERLQFDAVAKASKLKPFIKWAFFVKAWNAAAQGRKMGVLRWGAVNADSKESIPSIIGIPQGQLIDTSIRPFSDRQLHLT